MNQKTDESNITKFSVLEMKQTLPDGNLMDSGRPDFIFSFSFEEPLKELDWHLGVNSHGHFIVGF